MAAVSTPVRQQPPQFKSAPTPVFDSPCSPDGAPLTPRAKHDSAVGAEPPTTAVDVSPAVGETEPATPTKGQKATGRKLFTSPGEGERAVVDATEEARAGSRAIFAAADARHERRLQIRADLCRVNEAIACLERAAWLHGLATKCGEAEDWGVSLDAVEEAILELEGSKLDEQLPQTVEELLLLRAGVLLKLEQFDAAARACSTIISRNPEHAEALARRGLCGAFLGKYEEARADLACAASLLPNSHPVHEAVRDVDDILETREQEVQMHATLNPCGVYP
jgi:tetratricopeptide (TPR) repeat protein